MSGPTCTRRAGMLALLAGTRRMKAGGGGNKLATAWRDLPELPQALGGQFVGAIDDRLLVAGGSYFNTPPWAGGKKMWVDTIYTLGRGGKAWRVAGHLPTPLGYGAAISAPGALLCVGGQTPDEASSKVYRLRLGSGQIAIDRLADLPQPASMIAGALAGDTVYVAGGQSSPQSTSALRSFWSLSLNGVDGWRTLEPWPGPARILPLMSPGGGAVYLVSGADLTGTPGPPPGRRFLRDAFRYTPGHGWQPLHDLPRAAQAGVAIYSQGRLIVLGGNDGAVAHREFELKENHPGFSTEILEWGPQDSWSSAGSMPCSLVTTGIARWGDEWVIAGGEARPAKRSSRVIAMKIL